MEGNVVPSDHSNDRNDVESNGWDVCRRNAVPFCNTKVCEQIARMCNRSRRHNMAIHSITTNDKLQVLMCFGI